MEKGEEIGSQVSEDQARNWGKRMRTNDPEALKKLDEYLEQGDKLNAQAIVQGFMYSP